MSSSRLLLTLALVAAAVAGAWLLAPLALQGLLAAGTRYLMGLEYAHGFMKLVLGAWHAGLLRVWLGVGVVGLSAGLAAGLAARRGAGARAAWVAGPVVGPVAVALLGAIVWRGGPWAWGSALLLGALLAGAGAVAHRALSRSRKTPRWLRVAVSGAVAGGVSALWFGGDAWILQTTWWPSVAAWPVSRLGPDVVEVEAAPPKIRSEYHDIDIVGSPGDLRAVVVAEESLRLLSFPLASSLTAPQAPPASAPLPPWWGPMEGLVMHSETSGGVTYYQDGFEHVSAVRWERGQWQPAGKSPKLPRPFSHSYLLHLADRARLYLLSIGAANPHNRPALMSVSTPGLTPGPALDLRDPSGRPLPTIREICWLGSKDRLILSPDFGDWLYLLHLDTGVAEPWVQVPTMDGHLVWAPKQDRVYAALPNRTELWVLRPDGTIERRISTQPGVRSVAVDEERRLVLAASVLTGQIWVHDMDSGALVKRISTVMPMVRKIALIPGEPEALLSTWTRLYRLRYAP